MTDPATIRNWIDRYLAGTITEDESAQLQQLVIADPIVAETMALSCELELLLEERLCEDSAANQQTAALVESMATGECLMECSQQAGPRGAQRLSRKEVLAVLCAVGGLACVILAVLWNGMDSSPAAAAAMTELNRIVSVSTKSEDRTYQITVEEAPPRRGPRPPRPPEQEHPSPSRPSLHGAMLHVRGGRQFVLVRSTLEGDSVVTGCNGETSWLIQPNEPVLVSSDLDRFSQGVPGYTHSVPLINVKDGLDGLLSAYLVLIGAVETPAITASSDPQQQLLVAVRKSSEHLGPSRIEIVYETRSGLIQQMRFVEMPQARRRPMTLLLTLIDKQSLDAKFFDHEFHHEADRAVEFDAETSAAE